MKKAFTFRPAMIVCLMILFLYACKKTGTSPANSGAPLFKGSWKLSKYEVKSKDSIWVQASPPAITAGYVYTFKADGSYDLTSGGYHTATGMWSIYDNGQSFELSGVDFHIAALNATTFQLTTDDAFPYVVNGTAATYYGERDTFTH